MYIQYYIHTYIYTLYNIIYIHMYTIIITINKFLLGDIKSRFYLIACFKKENAYIYIS